MSNATAAFVSAVVRTPAAFFLGQGRLRMPRGLQRVPSRGDERDTSRAEAPRYLSGTRPRMRRF